MGLKRGDTIFLMPEKDGSLKLFRSKLLKEKEGIEEYICNSDLCDDPGMLERIIVGNYILGRDARAHLRVAGLPKLGVSR